MLLARWSLVSILIPATFGAPPPEAMPSTETMADIIREHPAEMAALLAGSTIAGALGVRFLAGVQRGLRARGWLGVSRQCDARREHERDSARTDHDETIMFDQQALADLTRRFGGEWTNYIDVPVDSLTKSQRAKRNAFLKGYFEGGRYSELGQRRAQVEGWYHGYEAKVNNRDHIQGFQKAQMATLRWDRAERNAYFKAYEGGYVLAREVQEKHRDATPTFQAWDNGFGVGVCVSETIDEWIGCGGQRRDKAGWTRQQLDEWVSECLTRVKARETSMAVNILHDPDGLTRPGLKKKYFFPMMLDAGNRLSSSAKDLGGVMQSAFKTAVTEKIPQYLAPSSSRPSRSQARPGMPSFQMGKHP